MSTCSTFPVQCQSSEIQFWNMVWHTTPHYIQTSEFCGCSSGFSRTHTTPNSLPFQSAVFAVPVSYIKSFCWLMDGTYLPCHLVWGWGTLPASCIKSLTNSSQKSRCDNFEAHMARMIKLFRMVKFRRWKNGFCGLSANGVSSLCGQIYPHSILQTVYVHLHGHHRNYPLLVDGPYVSMFQFCLPFHSTVIKIPLTLHVTLLQFHCLSKTLTSWSGLTV